MATCSRERVPPKPVEPKFYYTLVLTDEEAKSLELLATKIGGDSRLSRRGDIDSIREALRSAGVPAYTEAELRENFGANAGISFKDTK